MDQKTYGLECYTSHLIFLWSLIIEEFIKKKQKNKMKEDYDLATSVHIAPNKCMDHLFHMLLKCGLTPY